MDDVSASSVHFVDDDMSCLSDDGMKGTNRCGDSLDFESIRWWQDFGAAIALYICLSTSDRCDSHAKRI